METFSTEFWLALLQIIWVNILLSGDNAIVIALACRNLPEKQRKMGIFWGVLAAVVLRVVLTIFAVKLLELPYLKFIGGLLLIWIGVQLIGPQDEDGHEVDAKGKLFEAIKTILIADLAMSLDNVIAVAGAAKGEVLLLVIGLAMSIPLVVWGSKIVMIMIERFSWTILLGGGLLGYLAGEMIDTDTGVGPILHGSLQFPEHYMPYICVVLVLVIGKWLTFRAAKKNGGGDSSNPAI